MCGQNVPLCAVEYVVKKLSDVFVTAVLLSHTQVPPAILALLREDLKNRGGLSWGVLSTVVRNNDQQGRYCRTLVPHPSLGDANER